MPYAKTRSSSSLCRGYLIETNTKGPLGWKWEPEANRIPALPLSPPACLSLPVCLPVSLPLPPAYLSLDVDVHPAPSATRSCVSTPASTYKAVSLHLNRLCFLGTGHPTFLGLTERQTSSLSIPPSNIWVGEPIRPDFSPECVADVKDRPRACCVVEICMEHGYHSQHGALWRAEQTSHMYSTRARD